MAAGRIATPASNHGNFQPTHLPRDLAAAERVWVREDKVKPHALSPNYTGPYRVLEHDAKAFKVDFGVDEHGNDFTTWVSVDRLKPHYGLIGEDTPTPQRRGPGRPRKTPPAPRPTPDAAEDASPPTQQQPPLSYAQAAARALQADSPGLPTSATLPPPTHTTRTGRTTRLPGKLLQ